MYHIKKTLGSILIEKGYVTKEQVAECIDIQRKLYSETMSNYAMETVSMVSESRLARERNLLLGQIMVLQGYVDREKIEEALSEQENSSSYCEDIDNRKLMSIIDIISLINNHLNPSIVLGTIMEEVTKVTNSVASTLMLLEKETGELVFSVPTGPKKGELTDIRLKPGEGIAGWVAMHEFPVLIPDARKDPRVSSRIDRMSGLETKTLIAVPLIAKGRLIGVLEVINKTDDTCYGQDDLALLIMFANAAAIAIDNARMFHDLESMNQRLEKLVEKRTSELQMANKELSRLANLDGLTQISNRRRFDEYLKSEWARALKEQHPLSLILCDVDFFKLYNDSYGHQAGDVCLKIVARLINDNAKQPTDLASRYGGEEFALILPETDLEKAQNIAERIRADINDLKMEHQRSKVANHLTLSLGISCALPTRQLSDDKLLAAADKALYQAKARGRNRFFVKSLV